MGRPRKHPLVVPPPSDPVKFARYIAFRLRGDKPHVAATAAGYVSPGVGQTLERDPRVIAQLNSRMSQLLSRSEVTAERIVRELALIAFSDHSEAVQVVNGKSYVSDTADLPAGVTAAIESISQDASGKISVKFHKKTEALAILAKYAGLYSDAAQVHNHAGNDKPASEMTPQERDARRAWLRQRLDEIKGKPQ